MFLLKKNQPKVAHIWTGDDTACRMYCVITKSTHWLTEGDNGLPICKNCTKQENNK